MGQSPSSLEMCIARLCGNAVSCMGTHTDPFYELNWASRRNLDIPQYSDIVYRPATTEDVAAAVKCAYDNHATVQARSGGHSFGNHAMALKGGLMIDLQHLKDFAIDDKTWVARLGSGLLLGEIDEQLHKNKRAMAHGTCPSVGIGGHASVGGLGPMSRMWGSALDQVLEVEVVTADGEIRRANETHNTDLFWAIRGAGPSFGIVTEYVVKTHAAPGEIVEYTYSLSFGTQKEMIPIYKKWQALASDPELDRRFSSQFIAQPLGALITGTFYGSEAEFKATGILEKLPKGSNISFDIFDWKADLVHQAELAGLALAGIPIAFDTKSLAIPQENLLDDDQIETLFTYMDQKKWLGLLWVVIFNTEGGAMGDRTNDETAYSHRDSVIMYQSYGIGITKVSQRTHEFIGGVHESMQLGGANHTYVGYIAPGMDRASAQEFYWGENLPRLRELKSKWDPRDIFRNPQSIEPLKSTE